MLYVPISIGISQQFFFSTVVSLSDFCCLQCYNHACSVCALISFVESHYFPVSAVQGIIKQKVCTF